MVENHVATDAGGVLVEVRDLLVQYKTTFKAGPVEGSAPKVVKAVDGVDLAIRRGEILSVVGESGSGKTTLGRSIVGLTNPTSGSVSINGTRVDFRHHRSLRQLWRAAQMIFQDPYSTFNPLWTIHDNLLVPIKNFKLARTGQESREAIRTALAEVGLDASEVEDKYPNQLSGGQRQRASIARALVVRPQVIIADEPVSMLDVSLRAGILELLRRLNEQNGLAIMFITHDLAVAQYVSDRIAVMYRGKMVEVGRSDDVIRTPVHPYTELLLRSAPRLMGENWSEKRGLVNRSVDLHNFRGCRFYNLCPLGVEKCSAEEPGLVEVGRNHFASCHVRAPSGRAE